jgi:regulator of sirC expression with transglutaminase-like and TPR domain
MIAKRGYSLRKMQTSNYFETIRSTPDEKIDLAKAALYIARDEYPDLDVNSYLKLLNQWGRQLKKKTASTVSRRVELLNDFLFGQMNFQGNHEHYYDPRNSFLNDVMDRKKGIPITLSVIYLHLAWKMGLSAEGVGFPGHFLVRILEDSRTIYVDAFHKGNVMDRHDCADLLERISEGSIELQESFLSPLDKKRTLSRMLRNLKGIYVECGNHSKLVPVMDKIISLNPGDAQEFRDRGVIHYKREANLLALQDFEKYLSMIPTGDESEMVRQYVEILRDYSNRVN